MAEFHNYICNKCGYEVRTEPRGYYSLSAGTFVNFRCDKCKEVQSVAINEMGLYEINCPECLHPVSATWNPIEGKCPKCGGDMNEHGPILMAD